MALFTYELPDGWRRGTYWASTYKIGYRRRRGLWEWRAWVSSDFTAPGEGFVVGGWALTRAGADLKASNARIRISAGRSRDPWPDPGEAEAVAAGGVTPDPTDRCKNCGHRPYRHVGPGTACLLSQAQAGSCSCRGWVPVEGPTPR